MAILPIKIYGSAVLRQKADRVESLTEEIHLLIRDLRDSLYYHQGVGLAANQIGVSQRLFVADSNKKLLVCINPVIVAAAGKVVTEEGCLSLPEIYVDVERSASLELEYFDENFQPQRIKAEGMLARVIQHEMDHLDGVTIADRAGFLAKKIITGKLKKLQKRVREAL